MYDKETLELKDVRQMLQNNELMKNTDTTEEDSELFVKGQRGRLKNIGPKIDPEASNSFSCYFCKKSARSFSCYFCKKLAHIKKNCMKYKEMLKRKGGKDSDGASINRKSDQTGVVEEANEDLCDVLMTETGKGKYSNTWLLVSGCTYHMCPKKE